MDEIQARLQETSQNCLRTYAEWVGKKRDYKAKEALQSAIHELRKVASRLEIDLAVSERDQMTSRPLPIPSHRSKGDAPGAEGDEHIDDEGQDFGNSGQGGPKQQQQRRRPQPQHGQQQRRPMQQSGGGQGGGAQGGQGSGQ